MKLYTATEYMSTDISFEKKSKTNLTTKIKIYIIREYMSTNTSFEKKISPTLHN